MIISRKRFEEEIYNRLEKERQEMTLRRAFDDIHRDHERDIARLECMIAKLEEKIVRGNPLEKDWR